MTTRRIDKTDTSLETREVLWRWVQYTEGKTKMPRLVGKRDTLGNFYLYHLSLQEARAEKKLHGDPC